MSYRLMVRFDPFSMCTIALNRKVCLNGIGETYHMQVCECLFVNAVLVMAETCILLYVFEKQINAPLCIIRSDYVFCTQGRIITHQTKSEMEALV